MAEDRKERAEPIDDDSARPRGGGPDSAKSLDNERADANQDSDAEEEPTPKKM